MALNGLLACPPKIKKMIDFKKKTKTNLPAILLILMLVLPFLLYFLARSASDGGVLFVLAIMGAVMLIAMKK
jgi:hypothetical protein